MPSRRNAGLERVPSAAERARRGECYLLPKAKPGSCAHRRLEIRLKRSDAAPTGLSRLVSYRYGQERAGVPRLGAQCLLQDERLYRRTMIVAQPHSGMPSSCAVAEAFLTSLPIFELAEFSLAIAV